MRNIPERLDTQYSECIDQLSVYFEEINDPHEIRVSAFHLFIYCSLKLHLLRFSLIIL